MIRNVVAPPPLARPGDRKRLLHEELEQLAVQAKRLGLSLREVVEGLGVQWSKLDKASEGKEA